MHRLFPFRLLLVAASVAASHCLSAQEPPPPREAAGRWQLETVRMKDGKEHRGLVQQQREKEIDFAEIIQRPGKPTFALIRGIDASQVAKVELLPSPAHAELVERFRQYRHRALIEAGRMEEVRLTPTDQDGCHYLAYEGGWFTLLSTADDELTRRCVVRIEQIFRAYRTLLPPRSQENAAAPPALRIYLFSSLDEYRQRLKGLELNVANPAIYSARHQTILAGGELAHYARRLAEVRQEMKNLEKEYDRLDKEFTVSLGRLAGELREKGFSKDEVAGELQLRKTDWKNERAAAVARAAEQDRRNRARFAEVTQAMFARLYHEAFHAYLDTYVYPRDKYDVPGWLHEGLAQVFEGGQLEGDSLRIDAPDLNRLATLQADIKSPDPLPLSRLLLAEGRSFVGEHGGRASQRNYLYAWGLSYCLVTEKNMLGSAALDRYVARESQQLSPTLRLERLLDQPFDQVETEWRAKMLKLTPPGK